MELDRSNTLLAMIYKSEAPKLTDSNDRENEQSCCIFNFSFWQKRFCLTIILRISKADSLAFACSAQSSSEG